MDQKITTLAQNITKASSAQTYYTIKLLADRRLVNDCFKAYAYFRWADDKIDIYLKSKAKRISFINRQKKLIKDLYQNKKKANLSPEEKIMAELIKSDTKKDSKLKSFIQNFFKIIEFDAYRKGQPISEKQFSWYSKTLGKAVTDCIQHFVNHNYSYKTVPNQYLAASAAHITHMLRDLRQDIPEGYINIPKEYLKEHRLQPTDISQPAYKAWVKNRVKLAHQYFKEGKEYLDELDVLRCKIVGYWYCARFEGILETIKGDSYALRLKYDQHRRFPALLRITRMLIVITFRHMFNRSRTYAVPVILNLIQNLYRFQVKPGMTLSA